MTGDRITDVDAWEALDSRGRPTVACAVTTASGRSATALAPSGASTGSHEALELRDGGPRYGGAGVTLAVGNVRQVVAPALRGHSAADQVAVDALLQELDGTGSFSHLGANASLAVSLAVAAAAAAVRDVPLHVQLAQEPDGTVELPLPMVNVFSGGAHAARAIDLQDYLVVPLSASSFAAALEAVSAVRAAAATLVRDAGGQADLVADEGGIAAPGPANTTALDLLTAAISAAGLEPGRDAGIAIDVASTQFATSGTGGEFAYTLSRDDRVLTSGEWVEELAGWLDRWPIVSLEDPLAEDDWSGWADITARIGGRVQLLGDDLFVTNAARLRRGMDEDVANAVLVKPNQVGTLTQARTVVDLARTAGYRTVLSARSGETEESWLADVAVAWRTGQIKVGSTMRSERTAKWNRLLEIEHRAGDAATYVGAAALLDGQRP